jgi:hypothetical protein
LEQLIYYLIYKTTNLVNGKEYIGKHQTKVIDDGYLGSGKNLKRAIKKYGVDNFKKTILFTFSLESDMVNKEIELVTEDYCSRSDTYNICPGGRGGFGYINNMPEMVDVRRNNLKTISKEQLSEQGRKNIAQARKFVTNFSSMLGKKHTEETRQKMRSLKQKAAKYGSDNPSFGKPRSEETKRKISETLKNRSKE